MAETNDLVEAQTKISSVLRKMAEAFDKLVTIRVETIQTELGVDKDEHLIIPPAKDKHPDGLLTEINMLSADIRYAQSPAISTDAGASLQSIHEKHVALSQEIFRENVKFVADTVQKLLKS